jgi:hypothetical protein
MLDDHSSFAGKLSPPPRLALDSPCCRIANQMQARAAQKAARSGMTHEERK